jgi:serine/threonine protein kinase
MGSMTGRIVSHYKVGEMLGGGGMGVVYRAEDTRLKRTVALKFLSGGGGFDPNSKLRFTREAEAASALQHANICTIHDIDETDDGQVFICMDYYEGETLKLRLSRGAMPIPEALEVGIQIASGLARAHEAGIVHRDIKPANIIITRRVEVRIVDFGLAKLADRSRITKTGSKLGTIAYMSPEQAQGGEVGFSSDVWSLGVLLYEMLTGERPFKGDQPAAVYYQILREKPPSLREIRPEIPQPLENLVTKAVEKDPAARFSSAGKMLDALLALRFLSATEKTEEILPPPSPTVGGYIEDYRITAVAGRGGMGIVYKALDTGLDRDVALKVMEEQFGADPRLLERFRSEAKALAKLDDPNIVKVYALRETVFGFCLVMEFVEGETLRDQIRRIGPLAPEELVKIFSQILRGLDHAHRAGVVHRDLKPSNIMITKSGAVKITDFGLAKVRRPGDPTKTAGVAGTPYYMSPEQITGLRNVDTRGDIFSLGMSLYESAAGRLPFSPEDSEFAVQMKIVEGRVPPADSVRPGLSRELVKVISKATKTDPAERFQSAQEMRRELESIPPVGRIEQAAAAPRQEHRRGGSRVRRWLVPGIVVALALAGIAFVLGYLLTPGKTGITVKSTPAGASVFLNGASIGQTPFETQAIEPGRVTLRLARSGFMAKDTTVLIEDGQHLSLRLFLDKEVAPEARMSVASQPETADVYVDGELAGQTPFAESGLTPGHHTIRVKKTGYVEHDTLVSAAEGEELNLFFRLAVVEKPPIMGVASFRVVPAGARVTVDGRWIRPDELAEVSLSPGKHTVKVSHAGYQTHTSSLRIEAGEVARPRYELVKIVTRGKLKLTSEPAGLEVSVNNQIAGRTPLVKEMKPGTYQVRIVHPEYGRWEKEVSVRKDQLSSTSVDFSRTFKLTVTCHNVEGRRIPDGELFLDGVKVKHYGFPCELRDLRVGLHAVEVRCDGYRSSSVRKNYDEPSDQAVRFVLTKAE